MKKTEVDAYLESTKFREGHCWKVLNIAWTGYATCDMIVGMSIDRRLFRQPDSGTIRPRLNELEMCGLIKSSVKEAGETRRGNPTVSYFITPRGWDAINGNRALFRVGMMGVRILTQERAEEFAAAMERFKEEGAAKVRATMGWYTEIPE